MSPEVQTAIVDAAATKLADAITTSGFMVGAVAALVLVLWLAFKFEFIRPPGQVKSPSAVETAVAAAAVTEALDRRNRLEDEAHADITRTVTEQNERLVRLITEQNERFAKILGNQNASIVESVRDLAKTVADLRVEVARSASGV